MPSFNHTECWRGVGTGNFRGIAMADQFDHILQGQEGFARGEDAPDVEGHMGVGPEIAFSPPVEGARNRNDEDEGPDVEGHFYS